MSGAAPSAAPLLEVRELCTTFFTDEGPVPAVDHVSFALARGETLALVGESGCGKSVTALSIMRLVAAPSGRIVGGSVRFDGADLLALSEAEMRAVRGRRISMVFQEPMTSLNPVYTAGDQVAEVVRLHAGVGRREAWERAVEMLRKVGIPSPGERARAYPHQLSGGMRQRVMIAMAIALGPDLLIADEPTTALDVTVQAQIVELLRALQSELGMGLLLITHDLGLVADAADRVVVMYAGQVVESADVRPLFKRPRHPYTQGLLHSVPSFTPDGHPRERLQAIPGSVPDLLALPRGCRFQDRCAHVHDRCRATPPALEARGPGLVRCYWEASP